MSGSPPEMRTSLIDFFDLMYLSASSKRSTGMGGCSSPTILFLVQYLQYIAQESVTMRSAMSGYLWTRPGTGEWESSPQGSTISQDATLNSSSLGMACFLMGHFGSCRSMSEKKYGVMAIASLPVALLMPSSSLLVRGMSSLMTSRDVILFLNCHFQSYQQSGRASGKSMYSERLDLRTARLLLGGSELIESPFIGYFVFESLFQVLPDVFDFPYIFLGIFPELLVPDSDLLGPDKPLLLKVVELLPWNIYFRKQVWSSYAHPVVYSCLL